MTLSTHVLDLSRGVPAADIPVRLERQESDRSWAIVSEARTDEDGRVRALLPEGEDLRVATYRLTFELDAYQGDGGFFPTATVVFRVTDRERHYHVPLLLSPFGYSTYRGS